MRFWKHVSGTPMSWDYFYNCLKALGPQIWQHPPIYFQAYCTELQRLNILHQKEDLVLSGPSHRAPRDSSGKVTEACSYCTLIKCTPTPGWVTSPILKTLILTTLWRRYHVPLHFTVNRTNWELWGSLAKVAQLQWQSWDLHPGNPPPNPTLFLCYIPIPWDTHNLCAWTEQETGANAYTYSQRQFGGIYGPGGQQETLPAPERADKSFFNSCKNIKEILSSWRCFFSSS